MAAFLVIEDIHGDFVYTRPEQVQTIRRETHQGHNRSPETVTVVKGPRLEVKTRWTPQEVMALVDSLEA